MQLQKPQCLMLSVICIALCSWEGLCMKSCSPLSAQRFREEEVVHFWANVLRRFFLSELEVTVKREDDRRH